MLPGRSCITLMRPADIDTVWSSQSMKYCNTTLVGSHNNSGGINLAPHMSLVVLADFLVELHAL